MTTASPQEAVELTAELLRGWPLPLDPGADKHDRGTVLVIAGTVRTPGAAVLAGTAALRAGAGRLQIATADPVAAALAAAVPEALVQGVPVTRDGSLAPTQTADLLADRISSASALLVGPGFDDVGATGDLVAAVMPHLRSPTVTVLDAMAVRAYASARDGVEVAGPLVLTPNREEVAALLPDASSDTDGEELAGAAARLHGAAVTVASQVAAPDGRRWTAGAAVPGLGTSGSGDVLAGLVAGCAARSHDAAQAACWGTFLHVEAGRSLATRVGAIGYLARELLGEIPRVMDGATPRPDG